MRNLLFFSFTFAWLTCSFAQNVGVGESNPASKLATKGNLSVGTNYSTTAAPTNGAIIEGKVGIGTNTPDASAKLEVLATDGGVLLPRVSLTNTGTFQLTGATNTTSMLVYNSNAAIGGTGAAGTGFYYWNGTIWVKIQNGATSADDWHITGNGNITPATHFLGTTTNVPLKLRTNNQYSGEINPNGFVALGYQAGLVNTATANTFVGGMAGTSNTSGDGNVALGTAALTGSSTASYNVAVGAYALSAANTSSLTTAVGYGTLTSNTSGAFNTAVGANALSLNSNGNRNVAVGQNALVSNTLGSDNVAMGRTAANGNSTSGQNIAIGTEALYSQNFANAGVTWNSKNIAIGYRSLYTNNPTSTINGINNIAIGTEALDANTTGNRNIAIGTDALGANTSGVTNVAIGRDALSATTTTSQNTALGTEALKLVVGGTNNTGIGYQAGGNGNTGDNNTLIGSNTAFNNTGNDNVVIGHNALTSKTTGNQNTVIGKEAGFSSLTGAGNILIGYQAGYNETGNNKLYIENSNSTAPLIGGDFATNRVGINSMPATNTLYIAGGGALHTSNNWQGAVELNVANAIAWRANSSTKTFGMGYTDNGFFLYNATNNLGISTAPAQYRMIMHDNGGTSIGGNMGASFTPNAPLHVDGFLNGGVGNFAYFSYNGTCNAQGCASGTTDVSIYATNRVRATEFNAFSDARIKQVVGISNNTHDLETLAQVQVTDYTHIDKVSKGAGVKKGFIAQQVETVFPEAVSLDKDFIPNIYAIAKNVIFYPHNETNGTLVIKLDKKHDFVEGDVVRLISDKTYTPKVSIIDEYTFKVENWEKETSEVFVYGKQVADFRAVDYDRIFTLNVSATQELYKRVQALEQENAALKTDKSQVENSLQQLNARLTQLEVRLQPSVSEK